MKFETVERDEESLTTKVSRIWLFDSLSWNPRGANLVKHARFQLVIDRWLPSFDLVLICHSNRNLSSPNRASDQYQPNTNADPRGHGSPNRASDQYQPGQDLTGNSQSSLVRGIILPPFEFILFPLPTWSLIGWNPLPVCPEVLPSLRQLMYFPRDIKFQNCWQLDRTLYRHRSRGAHGDYLNYRFILS